MWFTFIMLGNVNAIISYNNNDKNDKDDKYRPYSFETVHINCCLLYAQIICLKHVVTFYIVS